MEDSVARLAGVGGKESRRQAYMDVFTASCQASYRTLDKAHNSRKLFMTES
ncbi:protein of unknown function [Methylotuvimicrobium alcaliphilum 20Z]|uniref:Uncharacterized protein n=1 Tax=Methylotuvimicrobium alcaliphilum (strain DSM 19304 / NCIMB 14124 / VKM B-2133 / 20Z) TaxID=1091494 RepID=G4T344_META2|nr:protein of unknown function [Methylotuvimicrobium alcaliphilum 20Z]